jgi:hypothetical protein
MSSKFHKIRRLYGPSLLVKPTRNSTGDMDPIPGPCTEQAAEEFAGANWRDDSGGAMSAIVGADFEAATTPAARMH